MSKLGGQSKLTADLTVVGLYVATFLSSALPFLVIVVLILAFLGKKAAKREGAEFAFQHFRWLQRSILYTYLWLILCLIALVVIVVAFNSSVPDISAMDDPLSSAPMPALVFLIISSLSLIVWNTYRMIRGIFTAVAGRGPKPGY